MSDIDKNSIVISKVIQTMEDFHSVLKLVEEKLQESSNFLFLMLENTEKDEEYFDEFSFSNIDVKMEDDKVNKSKEDGPCSRISMKYEGCK